MRTALLALALYVVPVLGVAEAQAPPLAERPTITVAVFDFGGVSPSAAPTRVRHASRRYPPDYSGYDTQFAEAIGTGAADLIVERLVQSERFRVFERKQLAAVTQEQNLAAQSGDTVLRARYMVTGSVSRIGYNDKDVGGLLAGMAAGSIFKRGLGAFKTSASRTTVHLTARVVDTRTGEIIGSFTGEGKSDKRWGVSAIGMGPGGMGAVSSADANFRETAIGEATERAATAIVESVIALRATTLKP